MTAALTVGWVVWGTSRGRWHRWSALVVAGLVVDPVVAIAAGLGVGLWLARRRLVVARRDRTATHTDLVVLADLVTLGLTAGLSIRAALDSATAHVRPALAAELAAVIADADQRGLAAALANASGQAERLFRLLARAVVSGASAREALESYARELRHAAHATALADARRLPVRLLLPLSLLILPGFVVLAVGPALIDAVDRLGGIS